MKMYNMVNKSILLFLFLNAILYLSIFVLNCQKLYSKLLMSLASNSLSDLLYISAAVTIDNINFYY